MDLSFARENSNRSVHATPIAAQEFRGSGEDYSTRGQARRSLAVVSVFALYYYKEHREGKK
jgi:hypothetical protein